jgi:hypothetical protein
MKRRRRRLHSLIGAVLANHNSAQRNPNPSGPTKTNHIRLVREIGECLRVVSFGTPMLALLHAITCVISYALLADPTSYYQWSYYQRALVSEALS